MDKNKLNEILDTPTEYLGRTAEQNDATNQRVKDIFIKYFGDAIDNIDLTESEVKSLKWLCNQDNDTIQNMSNVIKKASAMQKTQNKSILKNYDLGR